MTALTAQNYLSSTVIPWGKGEPHPPVLLWRVMMMRMLIVAAGRRVSCLSGDLKDLLGLTPVCMCNTVPPSSSSPIFLLNCDGRYVLKALFTLLNCLCDPRCKTTFISFKFIYLF